MQKWDIAKPITDSQANTFAKFPRAIVQLLYNRGITQPKDAELFLYPDYARDLHDPFLFTYMQKAVERIFTAIEKKEKIIIYGDYDADGICSAALLTSVLEALGSNTHEAFLPNRKHGYGLSLDSVERFFEQGVNLIITVDCGIVSFTEIKNAQDKGIDVIITDHHIIQDKLPSAFAIIHPALKDQKYPFELLAGVGVSFKLAQGLIQEAKKRKIPVISDRFGKNIEWNGFEKWLLDLVCIATIADMVPLIGENRVLVKYGLLVLAKSKRVGLSKLMDVAQIDRTMETIDSFDVGFRIAPRLNATGRLDSGLPSYDILVTKNEQEAQRLALLLDQSNAERQNETEKVIKEAIIQIKDRDHKFSICVIDTDWHLGVIGLAAGKLMNQYYRPVLVSTEVEGVIRGSGRSIKEFNIMSAMKKLEKYFSHYGGHAAACGFTLKDRNDYNKMVKEFNQICHDTLVQVDLIPTLKVEAVLQLGDITWKFYEHLLLFEPFGQENFKPLFMIKNVTITQYDYLGKNQNHVRISVSDATGQKDVMGFGWADMTKQIQVGQVVDMVVEISKNVWNGNARLQLILKDWKKV